MGQIYEDGIASAAQKGVRTGEISKVGFTVLELLITIAVLMLVAALLLPALSHGHHECRINCTNNLKQIGLSFKTWSLDNQDRLPMDVPVTEGGAKEALAQGQVYVAFQVMSNELSTPKVLVCPNDQQRQALTGAM